MMNLRHQIGKDALAEIESHFANELLLAKLKVRAVDLSGGNSGPEHRRVSAAFDSLEWFGFSWVDHERLANERVDEMFRSGEYREYI